jgi:hypothetical protein
VNPATPEPRYELPVLPPEELARRAYRDCEAYIKQLTDKKILIEQAGADRAWEPDELRSIYDADFVLWRSWKKMDVFVDEHDNPVGFFDHGKLAPCEWKPISQAEVSRLASDTGYIPKGAGVLSMKTLDGGVIEARLIAVPTQVDSPRYIARINPLRRAVISVAPEGAEA